MKLLNDKFNVDDFTYSRTATAKKIPNIPTAEHIENLKKLFALLKEIQARLSTKYGKPIQIRINSGYRSKELNAVIPGASLTSQHCLGQAADTFAIGVSHNEYYQFIKSLVKAEVITVGQCIQEFGRNPDSEDDDWVHISTTTNKHKNVFMIKEPGKPYRRDLS